MKIVNNLRCVYLMYNSKLQHLIKKKKKLRGKNVSKLRNGRLKQNPPKPKNGNQLINKIHRLIKITYNKYIARVPRYTL